MILHPLVVCLIVALSAFSRSEHKYVAADSSSAASGHVDSYRSIDSSSSSSSSSSNDDIFSIQGFMSNPDPGPNAVMSEKQVEAAELFFARIETLHAAGERAKADQEAQEFYEAYGGGPDVPAGAGASIGAFAPELEADPAAYPLTAQEEKANLRKHRRGVSDRDSRTYVYNDNTDAAYDIYHATSMHPVASKLTYHAGEAMRKLTGSNCIEIERGKVTKYFMCLGCVIENAMGCINDMRQNKSGNVETLCHFDWIFEGDMSHAMERNQSMNCCPKITSTGLLRFKASAYPETLRCIRDAGCEQSTIYSQLLNECQGLCDYVPEEGTVSSAYLHALRYGWHSSRNRVRRLVGLEVTEAQLQRERQAYAAYGGEAAVGTGAGAGRGQALKLTHPEALLQEQHHRVNGNSLNSARAGAVHSPYHMDQSRRHLEESVCFAEFAAAPAAYDASRSVKVSALVTFALSSVFVGLALLV